jgi:hypothetical protein
MKYIASILYDLIKFLFQLKGMRRNVCNQSDKGMKKELHLLSEGLAVNEDYTVKL